jgi:hypothetical protein
MGADLNQGSNTNISLIPGFPIPGPGQTLINLFSETDTSSTAIYTVTSGKTLYVYGFSITNHGGTAGSFSLTSDGNGKFEAYTGQNENVTCNSSIPIFTVASAKILSMVHNFGGASGCYSIWGFEQ